MEISVKMLEDEFLEYMEWKKERDLYAKRESALQRELYGDLEELAEKVLNALEERGETDAPEYRVKSQGGAAELFKSAVEVFA